MGIVETVVVAFWATLPAYVPNNAAVLAGGSRPIDGGRTLGNERLLGDGKTWRGTAAGTLAGPALALVLDAVRPGAVEALGVQVPEFGLVPAVALALGAMAGDITASFFKRRTGRRRGASFPLVDQLDFVAGALGLTLLAAPRWFFETFTLGVITVVVVATPLIHLGVNGLAYAAGLTSEPY